MEVILKTPHQGESILGIDNLPGRKQKALYMMHGSRIVPVAFFKRDEDAEWVERFLRELVAMANSSPGR